LLGATLRGPLRFSGNRTKRSLGGDKQIANSAPDWGPAPGSERFKEGDPMTLFPLMFPTDLGTLCRVLAIPALLVAGMALTAAESKAKTRIIVLCTGNSARSQMSAGFLKSFDAGLEVHSAGTAPAARVNPFAIRAMKEVGIDISGAVPRSVSEFLGQPFDHVITVCDDADKNCPNFRGKVGKRVHIGFPDPARAAGSDEEKMAVFRKVRDDIRKRFREYYDVEIRAKAPSKDGR
jgi:arsenate reductase